MSNNKSLSPLSRILLFLALAAVVLVLAFAVYLVLSARPPQPSTSSTGTSPAAPSEADSPYANLLPGEVRPDPAGDGLVAQVADLERGEIQLLSPGATWRGAVVAEIAPDGLTLEIPSPSGAGPERRILRRWTAEEFQSRVAARLFYGGAPHLSASALFEPDPVNADPDAFCGTFLYRIQSPIAREAGGAMIVGDRVITPDDQIESETAIAGDDPAGLQWMLRRRVAGALLREEFEDIPTHASLPWSSLPETLTELTRAQLHLAWAGETVGPFTVVTVDDREAVVAFGDLQARLPAMNILAPPAGLFHRRGLEYTFFDLTDLQQELPAGARWNPTHRIHKPTRGRVARARRELAALARALEAYQADHRLYPPPVDVSGRAVTGGDSDRQPLAGYLPLTALTTPVEYFAGSATDPFSPAPPDAIRARYLYATVPHAGALLLSVGPDQTPEIDLLRMIADRHRDTADTSTDTAPPRWIARQYDHRDGPEGHGDIFCLSPGGLFPATGPGKGGGE